MADVDAAACIEQLSSPAPWNATIIAGCLRPDYLCTVVEHRRGLAGFAIANHAVNEGHLLNIAIHPLHRRQGLGSKLMNSVLASLERRLAHVIYLEVRRSNSVAIAFYRSYGFEEYGVRPDYYALGDGREDALTMKLKLLTER
ncbi:MAG: ribosomal-protein-alanine acetyltransferase [marine bacterium B5-7]|nr:MAG: ribosomal-protein-alanine acetyltransferase [marine bacterium B5-7]